MPKIKLSSNLKELRQKQNLTQMQMAELLDISRAAYSLYESGQRVPSIETLVNISEHFQLSLDDLLGYDSKILSHPVKRLSKSPQHISDEKALANIYELLDYAGLDFALTTDEIKRICKITKALHQALINDIKENTPDVIL